MRLHVHVSVSGLLAQDNRQLRRALPSITKPGGARFADVAELRGALIAMLKDGIECLPVGAPCEGFSTATGCPGHDR